MRYKYLKRFVKSYNPACQQIAKFTEQVAKYVEKNSNDTIIGDDDYITYYRIGLEEVPFIEYKATSRTRNSNTVAWVRCKMGYIDHKSQICILVDFRDRSKKRLKCIQKQLFDRVSDAKKIMHNGKSLILYAAFPMSNDTKPSVVGKTLLEALSIAAQIIADTAKLK